MIFISAGHHPAAPGAKWDRFIEHDEASIWTTIMATKLGESGSLVPTGTLQSKVDFINTRIMNGDIAIEIHFNAARDADNKPVGRGCETLYYPGSEKGKAIALLCQEALAEVFPPDRGAKEGWYRMDPERGPDFFLARTKCPAVIVEPEFVHRSELIINNRGNAIDLMINNLKEFFNNA
jgi:N-acetylmuramoyl-L-alanine amidase